MAEAHPSAAPEVASPAMDTHTPLSPADSEKTIVATQRSTTDKELENFEPTPSPAAPAIFSTDLGRRAKRDPPGPPYSPVLVRGNIVDGVALTASKYRNKYGRQYHCIFAPGIVPSGRFTIHDLWDRHDIHLDSPGYLEEVLRFIMKDNEVRVDNFALEWSEKHRDRVALLAGDMTTIYDRNDPMAIANNVFDEDTLKEWPRVFLWHVAHRCRTVLLEVSQQQQTTAAAVPVSDVGMTDRERLLATEPNPNAVVDNEQATLATTSSTRPQASLPTQDPASAVLPTGLPRGYVQQGPTGYLAPGRLSPQSSNYGPAQAPRGYQPQYGGYAAPGLGPLTASPQMNPPMLRNYRGRSARSTSSSSHNQPSPFSWHENHPMQPAHQPRQFSGPIPAAHSPRYPPPPSLAPHPGMAPPMLHPSTGVPPFPPGPSMMAPQAAGNLMPFPPMMGQGMMQPLDMYGQPSMDPDHQTYFQGPPNVRGTYIGDMTNNMQYTGQYGGPSHRPEQLRRGNQPNRPTALYNPYGAENPDFANVPTTYMGKRNGRNSISNGAGRGRKFSVGANSRPSHNQTNVDRGDHIATHNGNRHTEQPKKKVSYGAVDNTIVNDEVRGCNEKWMAPGNDYITHLWIGEVPLGVSIEEVRGMFAREAGVEAIKVTITENYAFVNFASSQDARTALQIEEPRLGGHPVSIKVPKMYFSQLKPGQDGPVSPYYKTQPRATRVAGAYDSGVLPMQQDQDRTADTAAVRKSVKYSPQDARSSLVPSSQPQNEDTLPPKESPAARRKKQKSPTKIAISTVTSIVTSPVASILTSPAVLEDVAPPVISENVTTPVVSEDVTSSVVSEDVTTAQTIDTTSDLATGAQKIVMKLSPVKKKAEKGTIPIDSGAGAAEIVEEKSSTSKPAEGEHNTIEPIGEEAHTDKKLSDEPVPKGEDRQSEQVIDETETSLQTEPEAIAHDTKDAHALQPVLSQEKVVQPEQATTADASKPQLSSTPSEPEVARPLENGKGTAVDVSTRVPDPSSEELVHNIKENTDKQPLPPVPEEAASDDDNKNDTSFVSAQESQGETVTQSEQPIIAKTDAVPEVVHATSEEVVQTQVTEPVPGSKPTETMTTTPQEEKPAGAATVSADASTETGKKPGLKQTESLHPFAKAKTLSKKERQAKKKEKKKEKEKTKVVVPAPSPTLTEDPISNSKLDSSQHKGPAPTGSVSMVDRAPATDKVGNKASLGLGNAADATTLGESVEKGDVISNAPSSPGVKTQELDVHSGHSETNKQEFSKLLSTEPVPSSDVASTAGTPELSTNTPTPAALKTDEKKGSTQKKTSARGKVAVPNLTLLKPTPPASKGSTGKTSPVDHGSANAQETLNAGNVQRGTSVASSSTLRSPSPPLGSPSPTAGEFFTPLQTPVTGHPVPAQPEAAKKKNRNKKKKGKTSATDGEDSKTPQADGEPFSEQLNQVDSIKSPTSKGTTFNSYYQSRDDLAAKEASNRSRGVSTTGKQAPEGNLFQRIHDYVTTKEKFTVYDSTKQTGGDKPQKGVVIPSRSPTTSAYLLGKLDQRMREDSVLGNNRPLFVPDPETDKDPEPDKDPETDQDP